jgi:hypothetical protein
VREFSAPEALAHRAMALMGLILLGAGAVSLFDAAFLVVVAGRWASGPRSTAVAAGLVAGLNGASRAVAVGSPARVGRGRVIGLVLGVQAAGQLLLAARSPPGRHRAGRRGGGRRVGRGRSTRCSPRWPGSSSARAARSRCTASCTARRPAAGCSASAGRARAHRVGPATTFLAAAGIGIGSAWVTTALRRPGLPRTLPTALAC